MFAEEQISAKAKRRKASKPLQWVLYTHEPMKTFKDAWRALGRYEHRWVVEDYHKAAKTGCEIENRYYRTNKRLERVGSIVRPGCSYCGYEEIGKNTTRSEKSGRSGSKKWLTIVCMLHRQRFAQGSR